MICREEKVWNITSRRDLKDFEFDLLMQDGSTKVTKVDDWEEIEEEDGDGRDQVGMVMGVARLMNLGFKCGMITVIGDAELMMASGDTETNQVRL